MDCAPFRDLLGDELDGRLAKDDAARLASHLATCAACARERWELTDLRATFRAMPRAAAPAGFRDGVMSSLPRARLLRLPRALGWIAAVAAVAVVAITLVPGAHLGTPVEREVAMSAQEKRAPGPFVPAPERATADEVVVPKSRAAKEGLADRDEESDAAGAKSEPAPLPDTSAAAGSVAGETEKPAPEKSRRDAREPSDPPPPPTAPPAPTAPAPPELTAQSAMKPPTRYVVFTDAAAAQRFANELADLREAQKKTKASAEGADDASGFAAKSPAPKPSAPSRGAAEKSEDEWRAGVLAKAAFSSRRVLVRAPMPEKLTPAELASRVANEGGAVVSDAETREFATLLDGEAEPAGGAFAADKAKSAAKDDEKQNSAAGKSGADARGRSETNVGTVVIVVLERTPQTR